MALLKKVNIYQRVFLFSFTMVGFAFGNFILEDYENQEKNYELFSKMKEYLSLI